MAKKKAPEFDPKINYAAIEKFKPDLRGLRVSECYDRCIYRLISRHLKFGVFMKEHNAFIGLRNDNNIKYLYVEQHWDMPEPYGVARACEIIGELPDNINYYAECECFAKLHLNDDLFAYLLNFEKELAENENKK
jgi:hypothetical protein